MKDIVLGIHVAGGFTGLATLLIPLLTKKGGRWHKRAGWGFVAGMSTSAVSGLVLSVLFLLAGRTATGVFFGVLSLLLGEGVYAAIAAVRRKKAPEPSPRLFDRLFPILLAVVASGAIVYGLVVGEVLMVVFSTIALVTGIGDYRFASRALPSQMAWWYQHMSSMMGACIAAVTAFLVVNVARLAPNLPEAWAWVPWILPSAVMVPIFQVWIRRYRTKFERGQPRRSTIGVPLASSSSRSEKNASA
ncbi:MAG: DUF2306 domain-containing protein [Deltaproteobacteria bacterium]